MLLGVFSKKERKKSARINWLIDQPEQSLLNATKDKKQ